MRSSGCASAAVPMSASASTSPIWCRRRSCSFRWRPWWCSSACSTTPLALILVYPTFLVPFCTWLLIGYFKSIPYELEECALVDGATRLQILRRITLPLAVPGLISAGIFSFTLSWNEFIYALAFIQSSANKTGAGRDPDRTRLRRRLPVGRADGGLAARLAAGCGVLLTVRGLPASSSLTGAAVKRMSRYRRRTAIGLCQLTSLIRS